MTLFRFVCMVLLACGLLPHMATAQETRPQYLLTASASRESQPLTGQWTYGKDLYRTGLTDING